MIDVLENKTELQIGDVILSVKNLCKYFGENKVLNGINIDIKKGDVVVLCAEKVKDIQPIDLKEIVINEGHSWNGVAIKNLDISRFLW